MLPMITTSRHRPWRALLLLWAAAILIDLWGIQQGPLRDWDEALVARVALELSQKPWPDWLLPSMWGQPYLNKPPGAHWLVGALIRIWQDSASPPADALPPTWLLRIGPALGSSLLSPTLALVQWQLRPGRRADALWTGIIALTLLPLARHAHLAMLDGLQLSASAAVWLALLLPRRGSQPLLPGLAAGLGASILLLLKAPVALPVLLVALGLRWADADLNPPDWRWLMLGVALGLLPGLAWHGWHLAWRGEDALVMWGRQGLARVTTSIENHQGGPIPPLIQVLSGGWPWLPLWPEAIRTTWQQRRERWGRWCLGLTALASLMVLPLQTQLPWYSLLLWPPFCLCCGPAMAALVDGHAKPRLVRGVALIWAGLGGLMLLTGLIVVLMPDLALGGSLQPLAGMAAPAGAGLLVAGWGMGLPPHTIGRRRRAAGAMAMAWSLSLLLLFSSSQWNWELNERASVVPLQPLVSRESRRGELSDVPLLVEGRTGKRPSVRWYAQEPLSTRGGFGGGPIGERNQVLVVIRSPSPQQSDLVRRTGGERLRDSRCRLERSGQSGWSRWLCTLE